MARTPSPDGHLRTGGQLWIGDAHTGADQGRVLLPVNGQAHQIDGWIRTERDRIAPQLLLDRGFQLMGPVFTTDLLKQAEEAAAQGKHQPSGEHDAGEASRIATTHIGGTSATAIARSGGP